MSEILLVDSSNLAFTCFFPAKMAKEANPELYDTRKVFHTNIDLKMDTIYRNIISPEEGVEPEVIFVEDRPPKAKLELYPLYKSGRSQEVLEFNPKQAIKEYVQVRFPFYRWAWSDDNEADDTIASIVAQNPDKEYIIASSDKDLLQLLSDRVGIFRLTANEFADTDYVAKHFGLPDPTKVALYKALWGDSGDAIPNAVPRMQKQLLPLIARSNGTLEHFAYLATLTPLTARCIELLRSNLNQVRVNDFLARLKTDCEVTYSVPASNAA